MKEAKIPATMRRAAPTHTHMIMMTVVESLSLEEGEGEGLVETWVTVRSLDDGTLTELVVPSAVAAEEM